MTQNHKHNSLSDSYQRRIRVTNSTDARRLMTRVFFEVQEGNISTKHGKDIILMCKTFIDAIKVTELEKRIKDIEKQLKG